MIENLTDAETGGAINPKKIKERRKPVNPKIDEAIQAKAMTGGAIKKKEVKVRAPKKNPKVAEAIEKKAQGGSMRYHDPIHRHLHKNLSGRGGKLDPPYVRKKMTEIMSSFHPSVLQSYMKGKFHDIPTDPSLHPGPPISKSRRDPRPHVIDTGGSLSALHHSVDGVLTSVDTNFYSHLEVV